VGAGQQHPARPDPHRSGRAHHGSPELSEDYRICTPLPRVGEAEDVANLALFLLSDAASWITGQCINVDGGHILRRGPDFSAMLEPAFGADGLRGVVVSLPRRHA
jgi:hypothetical protein